MVSSLCAVLNKRSFDCKLSCNNIDCFLLLLQFCLVVIICIIFYLAPPVMLFRSSFLMLLVELIFLRPLAFYSHIVC